MSICWVCGERREERIEGGTRLIMGQAKGDDERMHLGVRGRRNMCYHRSTPFKQKHAPRQIKHVQKG